MPSFEKVITDNFYIYWYPFALERVFLKKLPKSLKIISNFFYFKESTYPLTCHNYLICNALVHLLLKRFLKEFPASCTKKKLLTLLHKVVRKLRIYKNTIAQ